jgi:hypothetical protein
MAFPWIQAIKKVVNLEQGGQNPATNIAAAFPTAAKGLYQMARGRQHLRRAEAAQPETQSRQLLQQQTLLDRQRRALQTGTATRRQAEMFAQAFKTGATQSFRGGGGTRGLNQLTQMFNQGVVGLSSQSQQQQIALLEQRGAVADTLAAQEREMGLLKMAKAEAKGEQSLKTGRSNVTAAQATFFSGGFTQAGMAGTGTERHGQQAGQKGSSEGSDLSDFDTKINKQGLNPDEDEARYRAGRVLNDKSGYGTAQENLGISPMEQAPLLSTEQGAKAASSFDVPDSEMINIFQ